MLYFCIDRFEGGLAVCGTDEGLEFRLPRSLFPPDVREGEVFSLRREMDETARRRAEIQALEEELFED